MVAVTTLPLAYLHILSSVVVSVVVLRDVLLVMSVGMYRFFELPRSARTFSEFMNVQTMTHQIVPNFIGKVSTFFQISWIFFGLLGAALAECHAVDNFELVTVVPVITEWLGFDFFG